jgi:hypothetical protein
MKKRLLILSFILSSVVSSMAQDTLTHYSNAPEHVRTHEGFQWDKAFFGGDLGLQFGDITYINIAPIMGYHLTERFGAGAGPIYTYLKYRGYPTPFNSYGGRVFSQYKIMENVLGYGEYQLLNTRIYDASLDKVLDVTMPALLLGGGYIEEVGQNSSFNIMILYNVMADKYSYYQNPIIRVGFNMGF